jgi:hypothetical protein
MEVSEIWHMAEHAGPFATALMMYLYFDERKERRSKDKELQAVLTRSIAVIDEVKNTMGTWLSIFERGPQQ